ARSRRPGRRDAVGAVRRGEEPAMTEPELPEAVTTMIADGRAHGVAVEVRVRPAANSLPEAAAILGLEPADIAKTLVVRKSAEEYLFAIVPGDRVIAWPKLR